MPLDQQEPNILSPDLNGEKIPAPETGLPSPEKISTPERPAIEIGSPIERGEPAQPGASAYQPAGSAAPYAPITDEPYRKYKQIEKVLEEDLGEIYNNLTPQDQKIFKTKGEETARSIFQLVYHKTKVKVKKIIKLIRNWLKAVPGINKFFLEQEAKIKADKIAALAGESKKVEF